MSRAVALLPILKKLIAFESLLHKVNKKHHESNMLRVFVDEAGLTREALKDQAALETIVTSVKATLALVYPKAEPTIEILERRRTPIEQAGVQSGHRRDRRISWM